MQFSIIITSYNQREFIKDAVDSALSAAAGAAEVIVVDDASTDGSQELLRTYGEAIRLVCRELNGGAGAARNCGAAVATGDYLVFLDGDDLFFPWAMEVYRSVVERKTPKMILGSMRWFRGDRPAACAPHAPQSVHIVDYPDYMRKDRPFGNSASVLVIDRRAFLRVRGWMQDMFPMDDQDLSIRLGDSGRTVQVLSPDTVQRREHSANTVHDVALFLPRLACMLERERRGEYPGGSMRRFDRYGLLGGLVFFWFKRAFRCGLYGEAVALLLRGWRMLAIAIARRGSSHLTGRRPCETIEI